MTSGAEPVRFSTRMLALALCAGLELAALRAVWLPAELARGQYKRAYYELFDGVTGLAIDEHQGGYMSPDVDLDLQGRLSVPPGRTIVVPVEEGVEYRVSNQGRRWAPYVVAGVEIPLARAPGASQSDPAPFQLRDAQALTVRDGQLAWASWDASRSWREDRSWIETLTAACDAGGDSLPLSLSLRGEKNDLFAQLGHCRLQSSMPVPPPDGHSVMVIVAGPNWATIEKPDGSWRTVTHVRWVIILAIIVVTLLLYLGLGALMTALFSVWIAILGVFGAVSALLGLLTAAIVGIAAALWAVTGILFGARWRARVSACSAVVASMLLFVGVSYPPTNWQELRFERARNRCGLIGYSTVRGDSLREGTAGAWEYLDEQCAPCRGSTARYAKEAQTIDWVRETVCASSFTLDTSGTLAFLGGGNDDFFWSTSRFRQLSAVLGLLSYAYQRPDEQTWERFTNATAAASRRMLDEQTNAIRQLSACAQARQQRVVFAHDFLIWDLQSDRSPDRRAMFEQRRDAAETTGGRFLDLREQLRARAGVSWFNDFIHPSAVAHVEIAELICRMVGDDAND